GNRPAKERARLSDPTTTSDAQGGEIADTTAVAAAGRRANPLSYTRLGAHPQRMPNSAYPA
ncbi:hypothetical protein AB2C27_31860, partial [Pseudomonas aeruginosa]